MGCLSESIMYNAFFRLDKRVIFTYSLVTALLFLAIGIYYLADNPQNGLSKAILMVEVQAYALFIFALVCLSSVFGSIYYHLQKKKIRRNTFAFVFSASMVKWVLSMLIFDVHLW